MWLHAPTPLPPPPPTLTSGLIVLPWGGGGLDPPARLHILPKTTHSPAAGLGKGGWGMRGGFPMVRGGGSPIRTWPSHKMRGVGLVPR